MSKQFLDCIAKGGDVKTKPLSKNRFQRFCVLDGEIFNGEIQTKKASTIRRSLQARRNKREKKKK